MLLSLAHNASGTHLPVATHIVLLDAAVGSEENAKALDSQAIARAHRIGQNQCVTVVRFTTQKSIEEEDHERIYGTPTARLIKKSSLLKPSKSQRIESTEEEESGEEDEESEEKEVEPKRKKRKSSTAKKQPAKNKQKIEKNVKRN